MYYHSVHTHTNPRGKVQCQSVITRLTAHPVADSESCAIFYDTKCPYWDQVSKLNHPAEVLLQNILLQVGNLTDSTWYLSTALLLHTSLLIVQDKVEKPIKLR